MASSPKHGSPDPTGVVKPDGHAIEHDGLAIEQNTYDIFSGESDRDAIWLEVVAGIEQARVRMQQIADADPGKYFIFDTRIGEVIARLHTKTKFDGKAKPQSGAA